MHKVGLLVLVYPIVLAVTIPPNPCPTIFQYYPDSSGFIYGEALIPYDNSTELEFMVNTSLVGNFKNLELEVDLANELHDLNDFVSDLVYNVFFPLENPIPKIISIVYNGKLYCSAPNETVAPGTIYLTKTHFLKFNRRAKGFYLAETVRPGRTEADIKVKKIGERKTPRGKAFSAIAAAIPKISLDYRCGISTITNPLINKGTKVERGAFPWVVAIFYNKPEGPFYICSGSLISRRHIVTAAHCTIDGRKRILPEQLTLALGKSNIRKWIPDDDDRYVEPIKISAHPDYHAGSSDADIAVIEMEEIHFTQYIRAICLWSTDNDLDLIVGKKGTIVGWGRDERGILTELPKQVNSPVVSQEECLRSNEIFSRITSDRTFCAGARDGSGPCNGDSGGGFFMELNGRYVLRGVVSNSISEPTTRRCDLYNFVVFCDASKYSEWLLSFINK